MQWRGRWIGVQDAVIALVVTALGVAEVWVPFESVYGSGSAVASTVGVVVAGSALAFRRLDPRASVAVFLVWLAIGVATLGAMHALFFGQVVPFMLALYSLARHGKGRLPAVGSGVAAVTLIFGDLFIEALQGVDEIVFHWTMCSVAFLVGLGLRASEQRAVTAALRLSAVEHESQEEMLAAVAAERSRIARELHDILAHSVSVMVIQAGAAAQAVDDDPAFVRRALESIRETGKASLDEVRRVVSMLRDRDDPVALGPQPSLVALDELVEASNAVGLHVDLETQGDLNSLAPGPALAVYRIVQESLTNVRRHSDATRVDVSLRVTPERVAVEVRDNGRAKRPPSGQVGQVGHGLIGMRERAALYGGELTAEATPAGFTVSLDLPLAATHG